MKKELIEVAQMALNKFFEFSVEPDIRPMMNITDEGITFGMARVGVMDPQIFMFSWPELQLGEGIELLIQNKLQRLLDGVVE